MHDSSRAHRALGPVAVAHGFTFFRPYAPAAAQAAVQNAVPGRSRQLVATANGLIRRVLFTIPTYAMQSRELRLIYESLFATLPVDAHFVVVTHDKVSDIVDALIRAHRDHPKSCADCITITIPHAVAISMWAEDPYVAVTTERGDTELVEPYRFDRGADNQISSYLAQAAKSDVRSRPAPLIFQGGNVLIGDRFVLVGADYAIDSLENIRVNDVLNRPHGTTIEQAVVAWLHEYLDATRTIVLVGNASRVDAQATHTFTDRDGKPWKEKINRGNRKGTCQPLFHLDMFVSLAGRGEDGAYRILVGSSKMAADELKTPLPAHATEESDALDYIAAQLAAVEFGDGTRFSVERNPLPLIYSDDEEARERDWYYATYNNVLVQDESRDRRVWLPTYGYGKWEELKELDDLNAGIWERFGYQVERLPDFHCAAQSLGAVHCMKKYLARGD